MPGIKRDVPFRIVLGNLNASAGGYLAALSEDEAYEDRAVMDAVLVQEAFLLHKIAESFYNGNRTNESGLTDIIKTVQVISGDLIPRHIGPVIGVKIDGYPGEACAASAVARLVGKNPLGLKMADGLYGLEDNRIFLTGQTLDVGTGLPIGQVYLFQWQIPALADLAAFKASDSPVPHEYVQCWTDLATAAVMPKEGALIGAAGFYQNRANMVLNEIAGEHKLRPVSRDAQSVGQ